MAEPIVVPRTIKQLVAPAAKPSLAHIQDLLNALQTLQVVINRNGARQPPDRILISGTQAILELTLWMRYPDGVPAVLTGELASVAGHATNAVTVSVTGGVGTGTGAYGFTSPGDLETLVARVNELASKCNALQAALNVVLLGERAIQSGASG